MKVLFLSDSEARALVQILKASVVTVPGGQPGWLKQSAAGKEFNYTHGMLITLARRVIKKQGPDPEPDAFEEEKERKLCVKRERMAAMRLAKKAFGVF